MDISTLPATKILASIKPSEYSDEFIREIICSGASLFRYNFNFIHDFKILDRSIRKIREISIDLGIYTGIAADLPGPTLKTKNITNSIQLKCGDKFIFYKDPYEGVSIKTNCENLFEQLQQAMVSKEIIINIDHALAVLSVKSIEPGRINTVAINDALIKNNKNISFPGVYIKQNSITDADKISLEYLVNSDFDFIFQSFVKCKHDVKEIRRFVGSEILLCAKIENDTAINNLNEIIQESDGVIVARGHLADELSERLLLPIYQRRIIESSKTYGKAVIVATELYYSMVNSFYPSRPDMDNVYNAVRDKVDVLFLSGETINSKDPCRVVDTLRNQVKLSEQYLDAYEIKRPTFLNPLIDRTCLIKRGIYPIVK